MKNKKVNKESYETIQTLQAWKMDFNPNIMMINDDDDDDDNGEIPVRKSIQHIFNSKTTNQVDISKSKTLRTVL